MEKASLDWQACVKLSNNKEDLAKELLGMLAKELPIFRTRDVSTNYMSYYQK